MVKIAIAGAGGRMGAHLIAAVAENPKAELSSAIEAPDSDTVGKDAGLNSGIEKLSIKITDDAQAAVETSDILIDFTSPEAAMEHLELASKLGKGIVIGTTGFSKHHRERIGELSESTKIVLSPNMSIGVNVLFQLVDSAARALGLDYDIEIIEAHHRHKVDAPSGTALKLAEVAAHATGSTIDKCGVFERSGIIGERKRGEIGVQTIRGGDIVGDHNVIFAGEGERIELIHRAHTRATFARGAVRAALWLNDKGNGLFNMHDVLGLK